MVSKAEMKRQKKVQLVITAVIIFLMVTSIAGFLGYDQSNPNIVKYEKYKFSFNQAGLWETRINDMSLSFYTLPQDILSIPYLSSTNIIINNAQFVVLLFDPEDPDAESIDVIRFDFTTSFPKHTQSAVTKNTTKYTLPIHDCSQASPQTPIIKFVRSNETEIAIDGYCILMKGSGNDYFYLRDTLLYRLYGVIND